ncbi:hypothetical protein G7Z17_g12317 [Cylindrodendrum hubeiense]|uniref:Oxysterol-binding protein n=1 Tax=Cylindrodendrum hubeiense TaxID=595255 RepID=A0A9P5GXY8_9HYPO|nr:hypothetical protein G7Z17_g12317 [Cylindrodendrum hubeiense]
MLTNWFAQPAGARSSTDEPRGTDAEDDTLVMEPDQGNVLSHIISQLRPGADLSRVVLPTFILEPRSMLERITKCFLPGVKKPLNPILGEIFTCYWEFDDNKRAYYISEQTSHHPPKSSYFYLAPDHHLRIDGTVKPRSRFLGNSAASLMEGVAFLTLLNRGKDSAKGEQYILTQPNMYARGILFGKMKYELGDHSFVRCPELDLVADIEFKTKGWVGGTYNAVGGTIKKESTGEILFELSGLWSEEMFIKDMRTGHREMFFNATQAKPTSPTVRPIEEQEERESQRLWENTAKAVRERNHELATEEKTKIEDRQREEAALRAQETVEWHPRLFRRVHGGPGGLEEGEEDLEWVINATIDNAATPEKQAEQVMAIYPIVKGQKPDQRHQIPPHSPTAVVDKQLGHFDDQIAIEEPKDKPEEGKLQNEKLQNEKPQENLIDFDEAPASQPPQPAKQDVIKPTPSEVEIQNMLSSTGKPADGPLIDFAADLKKDLPSDTKQ